MPRLFFGSSTGEGVMSTLAAPARSDGTLSVLCAVAWRGTMARSIIATTTDVVFMPRLCAAARPGGRPHLPVRREFARVKRQLQVPSARAVHPPPDEESAAIDRLRRPPPRRHVPRPSAAAGGSVRRGVRSEEHT